MSTSKMKRKQAFSLVELLVTFSILTVVGVVVVSNLGSSRLQARAGMRTILEENLNNTYGQWAQMGGTHSGIFDAAEFPSTEDLTLSSGSYSGIFDIEVIDMYDAGTYIRVIATVTNIVSSYPSFSFSLGNGVSADSRTMSEGGSLSFSSSFIEGQSILVRVNGSYGNYGSTNWATIGTATAAPAEPSNNITEELWKAVVITDVGTPYTSTLQDAEVSDSTGAVNSTAIRLKNMQNAPYVANGVDSITYEDYDITFTPTGRNTGYWTVSDAL